MGEKFYYLFHFYDKRYLIQWPNNNLKIYIKIWLKISFKMIQKWRVINVENVGVKNWPKSMQNDPLINSLKIDPKVLKNWYAMGGSKLSKIDVGDPGPQKRNFLKFLTFLQKLALFGPQNRPPKWAPIENAIPHKNACTFAPMGGSKMSLFGGSGGGPLGPKNVDTTI
jgi:hypothetical protein